MKPVYVINGFLESGKSEFISYTIAQPYFQSKGKTLLILCEEGEVEYEESLLKKTNTICEIIEDKEDFTSKALLDLEKKYNPERIIIEWNGMWNYKEINLPWHWKVEQQITTIDASTFELYYTNMRSLLAEMLRNSELIIFNRCDGLEERLASFKRNVKAVNQGAEIVFEDSNGEIDALFEDDLPFDIHADVIELDDTGYAIWFMDALDHLDRYVGKTIKFVATIAKPDHFPSDYFVPGRLVMTCCEDDLVFLGFACQYMAASGYRERDWAEITAVVERKYWADYKGEGPVLKALNVKKIAAPQKEVVSL